MGRVTLSTSKAPSARGLGFPIGPTNTVSESIQFVLSTRYPQDCRLCFSCISWRLEADIVHGRKHEFNLSPASLFIFGAWWASLKLAEPRHSWSLVSFQLRMSNFHATGMDQGFTWIYTPQALQRAKEFWFDTNHPFWRLRVSTTLHQYWPKTACAGLQQPDWLFQ